eukprot:TRINITY_DN0_c107_g1_i18.p2 TRINITY_DN0_c107_g1~~TRINITY_DN0_c107_g1_i18.p2  ORF type:complete len:348 (-),score=97.90 TRINITY_DN0_c107_g1_i18:43-1086(-)
MSNCKKDHKLQWSTRAQQEDKFKCGKCGEKGDYQEGRWCCDECAYDVCNNCKKPPPPNAYCPEDHLMGWSTKPGENPNGKYECMKCGKGREYTVGHWKCHDCDNYNICSQCRDPPPLYMFCEEGHPLEFEKGAHESGAPTFSCDECEGNGRPYAKGRWMCKTCKEKGNDYDVCIRCRAPPHLKCEKDHMLTWSFSPENYPTGKYDCDACGGNAKIEDGRWTCLECEHDVCTKCRKAKANTKCKNGDVLEWVVDPEDQMGIACDLCDANIETSKGRWRCAPCSYDVCRKCRPTDTCYMNHPLKWTSEEEGCKEGKFECLTCDGKFDCADGRWTCKDCGFDICPDCKPE